MSRSGALPTVNWHHAKIVKNDVTFVWDEACKSEFQYLKQAVMSKPLLQAIDVQKNLVIYTDACTQGYGFVAMQMRDGDDMYHAIGYGGRALREAETRYFPCKTKLTAVALALKQYEH